MPDFLHLPGIKVNGKAGDGGTDNGEKKPLSRR